MKKKYFAMIMLLPLITACNDETGRNATFTYDDSFPSIALESHNYADDNFVDFPTFQVATTNITFELSEDETYYIVSDKNHTLNTPELVIPSTYNGLPVKEIAGEGFAYKTWLESVYIPESITYIGSGAFNGSGIKTLYYDAKNVENFNSKNWVFIGSSDQSMDVYFGPNVESIPNRLFYPLSINPNYVPVVNNIYFAKNSKIKHIGDYAFYLLDRYETISLPNSIETIGDYAFYGSSIQEIKLPTSLVSIGDYAFSFNSLKHVRIPDSLTTIGEYAFYQCDELLQIDLSSSNITSIEPHTFHGCMSLKNLKFNDEITSIKEYAFYGNKSLSILDLPNELISIGEHAFELCQGLTALRLNSNLTTVSSYAFSGCVNVSKMIINSTSLLDFESDNHIFENLGKNKNDLMVIFSEGVTRIPQRMFLATSIKDDNPNINKLILPSSLTSIGENAFFDLSIANIDYLGTVAQFNNINIENYNNVLSNVICHG